MASTPQPSSRFSTLKVFRFTSPKPPPPPPKDSVYLYPSSSNLSVASFSNQSRPTTSPSRSPTNDNCIPSIRTPSPTPSSTTQHTLRRRQVGQSPSASMSTTTLSPDSSSTSGNSKRGFFRKVSALRKRSASKNTRTSGADEPTDDESISRPWNFQHNIHIDEAFQGIPPSWSSTLAELGYSEAEIALIMKGRRNRILESSPAQDRAPSTTPSRSQSPSSINPPVRSSSLRRQRSDGSISRSERSLRIGPPAPPPPLPLPPPPQPQAQPRTPQTPNHAPPAPPPTPASGGNAFGNANDTDGVGTPSEAQYVYIHHQRQTPNGLMAVPSLASVPVVQLPPVRQPPHSRTNSSTSTPTSTPTLPSRSASVRSERERRTKNPPPPRSAFRIVNTTSPPPRYSDDVVRSGSPPPLTLGDALRPRPQEKEESSYSPKRSPAFVPQDQIKTPPSYSPQASGAPHSPAMEDVEAAGRGTEAEREETEVHDHGSDRTSADRRPPLLSILPPRVSLRKDTLEDLSSWSASLFSSLPSALHDSPSSSVSTTATSVSSGASSQFSKSEIRRHGSKPSVTLPTIVLQPEVPEEDEEVVGGEEEELIEHDYSQTASPLYHELMGMMQGRAAAANTVGSTGSGSPASPTFQLDTASLSSHATSFRDSQLTIRVDPRRDSSRDSSASTSTFTHATIVRGASIVRRVRADVVTTPPVIVTLKGKEREQERGPIQIVQEDDDDSSSDATYSDDDDASGSPGGTLSLTSGPDSQEAAGWSKSPRQALRHGSPLPSPSPSPLRATFPEPGMEEKAQWGEERQKASTPGPYATPPPSAPPMQIHWSPTATSASNLVTSDGVLATSMEQAENVPIPPRFTSTGPAKPRYPSWLAAIVLPLAEFIDDSADPRVLFTDLSEIAQGESGSVYSAHAAPAVVPQFRPPTPRSPMELTEDESGAPPKEKQKLELVAIKRVPISRGGTEKLVDLRRELELARTLRHANVLRMERLYVDVVEESLWISMELMDRSLADVLAVVGEEVGSVVALEAQEGGSGDVELVELSEGMIARFVSDVLLALSYIRKHHIAHRDIRSDNLLVSRSGVLKLYDFSTAVLSPPGTPKRTDPVGVLYWQAPEMRTGLYDPLEVDVWSLGATTWELVHGDPPFADVQDPRHIVSEQLPPVRQPEAFSRYFHDFLHLCSQPAALRPDADELLNTQFVRTACPRSEIVRLLGQCKAIDETQLHRQSSDSDI